MDKLFRYFHTIKYLKFRQTFGRASASAKFKFKLFRTPPIPQNLSGSLAPKVNFIQHDPWNNADDLRKYKFNFLNSEVQFQNKIDWRSHEQAHLWRYNLHYFDFLIHLNQKEQEKFCLDWINENPPGKGTGWSPYPLSLRIVNWVKAEFDDQEILNSIYLQTAFLFRNLEFYHPGNHYLENAKALIFAGLFFGKKGESEKWLKRGRKIFLDELDKQILPDGVYFELTPMYHSIMMRGFLDVLNILPKDDPLYPELETKLISMSDFLISSTHPNGKISLFNDSAEEIAPPPEKLKNYFLSLINYEPKLKNKFHDAGYYIFNNDEIYMIIDGGKVGPDFLPAHAHADHFSFELSYKNDKIIVDTGIFKYEKSEERNYSRSTPAHNTLAIDKFSQAECWGSFRVARRFSPRNVRFEYSDSSFNFSGEFFGYSKLIGDNLIHKRIIEGDISQRQITITDEISGNGKHLMESFLHFHPDCRVDVSMNSIIINEKIKIEILEGELRLEESWYSPEFGKKYHNKKIVISKNLVPPAQIRYRVIF